MKELKIELFLNLVTSHLKKYSSPFCSSHTLIDKNNLVEFSTNIFIN